MRPRRRHLRALGLGCSRREQGSLPARGSPTRMPTAQERQRGRSWQAVEGRLVVASHPLFPLIEPFIVASVPAERLRGRCIPSLTLYESPRPADMDSVGHGATRHSAGRAPVERARAPVTPRLLVSIGPSYRRAKATDYARTEVRLVSPIEVTLDGRPLELASHHATASSCSGRSTLRRRGGLSRSRAWCRPRTATVVSRRRRHC